MRATPAKLFRPHRVALGTITRQFGYACCVAVGRVTCPISGEVAVDGNNPHGAKKKVHIQPGFFTSSVRDPLTKGMDNLKNSYITAMQFLRDTQCDPRTPFDY